jgi:hypothetical protein
LELPLLEVNDFLATTRRADQHLETLV